MQFYGEGFDDASFADIPVLSSVEKLYLLNTPNIQNFEKIVQERFPNVKVLIVDIKTTAAIQYQLEALGKKGVEIKILYDINYLQLFLPNKLRNILGFKIFE